MSDDSMQPSQPTPDAAPPVAPPAPPTPPAPEYVAPSVPGVPAVPAVPVYPAPGAQPVPVAAAPKKRKTWLIVLVIVALLACAGAATVGGLVFYAAQQEKKVSDTLTRADEHYEKASAIVGESASAFLSVADATPETIGDDMRALSSEVVGSLDTAEEELSAAQEEIDTLEESETKAAYLEAISETRLGLSSLRDVMGAFDEAGGVLQASVDASKKVQDCSKTINEAISYANKKNYTKCKSTATTAVKLAKDAEAIFKTAHKQYPDMEFDKATAFATKRREQAEVVIKLAEYGKAGNTSQYNKYINTFNDMNSEIYELEMPRIFSDPMWLYDDISEFITAATDHGAKADDAYNRARQAFDAGEW